MGGTSKTVGDMDRQEGFTLVELLFTMALVAILMTLGAFAARQFWFHRSLTGAQDQIATQLRALQVRAVAEGIPTRYNGAYFDPSDSTYKTRWGTVRYDTTTATCTRVGDFQLDAGVEVNQANFSDTGSGGIDVSTPITNCRTQLSLPGTTDFVFFFSRGTATASASNLRLIQPRLDGRTEELSVLGLTARVEKL